MSTTIQTISASTTSTTVTSSSTSSSVVGSSVKLPAANVVIRRSDTRGHANHGMCHRYLLLLTIQ
jgi:hypothetical protein